MAGRGAAKRNQRSSKAKARRRRRAVGLGGSAGAFLAFGLGPMATAPPAHADGLDVIIDPIINSVLSSVTALDGLGGIDPSAGFGLALPATDAAGASDPAAAVAASADPAASNSLVDLYNIFIYTPTHTFDQE